MTPRFPDPVPGPSEPAGRRDSALQDAVSSMAGPLADALAVKPLWRGWIHAVATPLAVAAGIVLVALEIGRAHV